MNITPTQLQRICPTLSPARAAGMAALMNELFPVYGITTPAQAQAFIAQAAHESREFAAKDENLIYSAQRIHEVWPARFPSVASAQAYARDSQKLANKVYANRMGNGDEASGDGYRFRGGGFIQLTGRDMYTRYAKYKRMDVGTISNLVRTEDRWALDSALWLFCIEKQLLDEAERDEFVKITRAINGGLIGLADRKKYYERAKAAIK